MSRPSWGSRLDPLGLVARARGAVDRELAEDPFQYDPDATGRLLPWMERWSDYFGAQVRGMDRVPASGPVMLIGNHSGGMITPDTAALYVAWYRRFGVDRPLLGMAFDAAFTLPLLGPIMRRLGQLPGSRDTAREALGKGAGLLVYPGGSREVFRPYSQRNQIQFHGRTGAIRMALEARVPIVPVVGHGGHETTVVLARGQGLAEALGLKDRLRLDVLPLLLQFPWGVSTPGLPGVPLPAKITMQVLEPLRPHQRLAQPFGTDPAADEALVAQVYEQLTGSMQDALDVLAAEDPRPLRTGLKRHLGRFLSPLLSRRGDP